MQFLPLRNSNKTQTIITFVVYKLWKPNNTLLLIQLEDQLCDNGENKLTPLHAQRKKYPG